MALTSFEEIRVRRGRPAVLAGILIWLAAVASSWFVGIITGIFTLFALGFPVQEIGEFVGIDPSIDVFFAVGWFVPVLAALIGIPVAMVLADRIGPWVLAGRPVDATNEGERRIESAVRSVALAAGEAPIVLVVDARWIDAAAFGRRRGRPVVIVSTAAAELSRVDLEMLAAGVLADGLAGNGAARARLASASPGLVPYTIGRRVGALVRGRPGATLVGLAVYLVAWTIALLLAVDDPENQISGGLFGALQFAVAFNVLLLIMVAILSALLAMWGAALSLLALPIGARARKIADVGMASLVRDPDDWLSFMAVGAHRPLHPPIWTRLVIAWLLPQTPAAANRRIANLRERVPGARHSLAVAPPVAHATRPPPNDLNRPPPPSSVPPPPPPVSQDAGWYLDPRREHRLRYFDGVSWTPHTSD